MAAPNALAPADPETRHIENAVRSAIFQGGVENEIADYYNAPRPTCIYGNCNGNLGPHDVVGTTFYIATNMMLAFSVFFFIHCAIVPKQWATSMCCSGLVTFIAFYNYTYMKNTWVQTQQSPTQFRYTDWLITVPLLIVEFYFLLKAAGPVPASLGLRLFNGSLVMIFCGWLAEVGVVPKLGGFVFSMSGWLYIIYEVTSGEAAALAANLKSARLQAAWATLRNIVAFGWTIYPLGFCIAYLCYFDQPAGVLSAEAQAVLNVTYNLADFINKGAFGVVVWSAAMSEK